VCKKLQGVEEGVAEASTALSVAALVERLLNQAADPQLLSQLFVGWAPWV